MGELVVGDEHIARVDEGAVLALEIRRDDERRQPLAEARGHVERARRTVPKQVDALQRAAQLGQQGVDLRARLVVVRAFRPAVRPARSEKMSNRGSMAARDLLEGRLVGLVGALGQARALEQLVGDALERRDDGDHRLAPAGVEQNASDVPDRRRCRQRRSAKFENFHRSAVYFTVTATYAFDQQHWKPPPPTPVLSLPSTRRM